MPTYTPIQSITTNSVFTEVTFSNIPQNYQDLVVVASMKGTTGTNSGVGLQFNGDTSALYSFTYAQGTGSTTESARVTGSASINIGPGNAGIPTTSNVFSPSIFHIQNYSNTTSNKTLLQRGDNSANMVSQMVGLWRSTSAITSIRLFIYAGSFDSGCTFDLYGISPVAESTVQAFGGTEIYYDSTHVYHVFKGSGVFTPFRNLTTDVLVIGGGGGGGCGLGGGGGAGGLRDGSGTILTANTNYTITVGAGGNGSTNPASTSSSGNSSSAFSITSAGGGNATGQSVNFPSGPGGGSGGSGGGGARNNTSGGAGNTPNTSPSQGNNGGSGSNSGGGFGGGGGGGAFAVGGNGSSSLGGDGGSGSPLYDLWALTTNTGDNGHYAGGGGGGVAGTGSTSSGGLGGGGIGGNSNVPGRGGVTNTGGGGGGGGENAQPGQNGGNGASGIVIVRYSR